MHLCLNSREHNTMNVMKIKEWLGWNFPYIFPYYKTIIRLHYNVENSKVIWHPYGRALSLNDNICAWMHDCIPNEYKIRQGIILPMEQDSFLIEFKTHKGAMLFKLKWGAK